MSNWVRYDEGDPDRMGLATQIDGRDLLVEIVRTSEGIIVDVYDDSRVGGECVATLGVCVNDLEPLPNDDERPTS